MLCISQAINPSCFLLSEVPLGTVLFFPALQVVCVAPSLMRLLSVLLHLPTLSTLEIPAIVSLLLPAAPAVSSINAVIVEEDLPLPSLAGKVATSSLVVSQHLSSSSPYLACFLADDAVCQHSFGPPSWLHAVYYVCHCFILED